MKIYQFHPEFAWDNNESYQEMDEFEAGSVEEVLEKVKEIINPDTEAEWAEDFYLTASNGEKEVFDFHFMSKLRNVTVLEDAETLFKILKLELMELFKDEQ